MSRTTQLSKGSKKKARQIVDQKMIEKLSENTWQVQSSNKQNVYVIELTTDGLYCDCPAWKNCFPHDCKHSEAVRIFEKIGEN